MHCGSRLIKCILALSGELTGLRPHRAQASGPRRRPQARRATGLAPLSVGQSLAAERGLTVIPPVEHPHIVGVQGTAAMELFEDGGELDALGVPVGGAASSAAPSSAPGRWRRAAGFTGLSPRPATTGNDPCAR